MSISSLHYHKLDSPFSVFSSSSYINDFPPETWGVQIAQLGEESVRTCFNSSLSCSYFLPLGRLAEKLIALKPRSACLVLMRRGLILVPQRTGAVETVKEGVRTGTGRAQKLAITLELKTGRKEIQDNKKMVWFFPELLQRRF